MPNVAELFDSFPVSKNAEIKQRRKEIFDDILEAFTKELDPEAERVFARDWKDITEGVPVEICITADDKEWLENSKTQNELKIHLGFADDRTDVTLSVEIKDLSSAVSTRLAFVSIYVRWGPQGRCTPLSSVMRHQIVHSTFDRRRPAVPLPPHHTTPHPLLQFRQCPLTETLKPVPHSLCKMGNQ